MKSGAGHVSPQFHLVFDVDFPTVPFMGEVTIPQNWIDIVQRSSQSGAPDNIDLKDTWFTPDCDQDPRETPSHKMIFTPYNVTAL